MIPVKVNNKSILIPSKWKRLLLFLKLIKKPKDKIILIPSKWSELNINQGLQIKDTTTNEQFAKILTGFDCDITPIIPYLEFKEEIKLIDYSKGYVVPLNHYSWESKILIQRLLFRQQKEKLTLNDILKEVLIIYDFADIYSVEYWKYINALSVATNIINRFYDLLKQDQALIPVKDKQHKKYEMLGVYKVLSQTAEFDLYESVAQAFNVDIRNVLEIEYKLVFQHLLNNKNNYKAEMIKLKAEKK
jgi:hypothetical protein